ncbi:hypothetical protein [Porphyrobacter sp. YT40]|uniref:hypothetical protein n=1 Tax=Porphyrobacter sp. YT40 TaxID=2547601 RepID=UPI001142A0E1|nr:hypothetical protein [Porphyrobacter sp. YT40]QDH32991.1 hypothetical protein E2E27_00760 [Porphyrobacter sp. YT40]
MPRARPGHLIALGLSAALATPMLATTVAATEASTDDPELVYECWAALDFASQRGKAPGVVPNTARAQFDALTRNDPATGKAARQAIDKVWADYRKQNGKAMLERYILGVAQDCAALYGAKPQTATSEQELGPLGTLSAGALRAYVQRTGDAGAVADYLVYHYPYGKDTFKPNADGDYLGELIVAAGAKGLRAWSDEAVYAIANKYYWQYNPPATRLIFAEYQRRMRAARQSEEQARARAEAEAARRAQMARSANARPVGSLGSGNTAPPRSSGIVVCTTYEGPNGGRVCKEQK